MRRIERKTKLYKHQTRCVQFHLIHPRSGNWSEMGVGKSLITLEVIRLLYNSGSIDKVLIISPLSVLSVWETEIHKHTSFSYTPLKGDLRNKLRLLRENTPIFLVSYDSLSGRRGTTYGVLLSALLEKQFDMIVVDEASYVKSQRTARSKAVMHLCDKASRTLFLSGTPIANNPIETLHLYRLMDKGLTFGRNIWTARALWFQNVGYGFPDWRLRDDKKEEFTNKLYERAIRFTKEECLDLPPQILTERYTQLTNQQLSVYKPIASRLLRELTLPTGKVKLPNILAIFTKLSQITSGFIYTDTGIQHFEPNPKILLLKEVLANEIPREDKVVIFAHWRTDILNICDLCDTEGLDYRVIAGDTVDRQSNIQDFVSRDEVKVLVAQIQAGAYGLNLAIANYVIYFSATFNAVEWWQSKDRIHRLGQKKPCIYLSLLCEKTIDTYMLQALSRKTDIAKSLLDNHVRLDLISKLKEGLI